jgi:cell division septum initiation protein DivIVA
MGLFDNFIKQIDNGLKAVENGALEERLNKVADKLDKASERAEKTLVKAAEKPTELLKTAEQKRGDIEARAKEVQSHVAKNIDILHKKD